MNILFTLSRSELYQLRYLNSYFTRPYVYSRNIHIRVSSFVLQMPMSNSDKFTPSHRTPTKFTIPRFNKIKQ
jgi:hypothetical protein